MSNTPIINTVDTPDWLKLPPALEGKTTAQLAARYLELSEMKLETETRAGCHPSGRDKPADVEPDKDKRAALKVSLRGIVREMAAVQWEINKRPDGMGALLPPLGKPEVSDGPWNTLTPEEQAEVFA